MKILGIDDNTDITELLDTVLNMNIIGYDVIPIDDEFSKEVGLMKADLDTLLSSAA